MDEERSYNRDRRASPSRHTDSHRRRSRSPHHKRRRTASPQDSSSRPHREERHRHGERSHHSHHSSSHRSRHKDNRPVAAAVTLPFEARHLTKHDLTVFEPLLAEFLYIQKGKDIYEMDDREVKGRWKSFFGKWNRGELAEGWYDPEMFARIVEREKDAPGRDLGSGSNGVGGDDFGRDRRRAGNEEGEEEEEGGAGSGSESEDYGPTLPGEKGSGRRAGVAIPNREDLTLRDEQRGHDRDASIEALRDARKADRKLQKDRLDDLVPRAEPGTRERRLEKKAALNEKLKGFRDKSPGGGEVEVGDGELMGGGDEMAELKREKMRVERRKTEREVRREEEERIKEEEREERRRAWKEREEGTVGRLRELAMARFGSK